MKFSARCVRSGLSALALTGAVSLAGCATTSLPDAPKSISAGGGAHYKVGAPYKIAGKWYAPKVDTSYDETGLASWYGDEFNGRPTANGEIFDKRRLSAAHKTLPLPTLVEVENLANHKKIIVRVNDRGPFVGDRIIDLSHAAARELGFEHQGVAKVRVRYVGEPDVGGFAALPGDSAPIKVAEEQKPHSTRIVRREAVQPIAVAAAPARDEIADLIISASTAAAPTTPTPNAVPLWVEVAQIDDLNKLEKMRFDIPGAGPIEVATNDVGGQTVQVLRLGPFSDEALAATSLTKAQAAGFNEAKIVRAGAGSL